MKSFVMIGAFGVASVAVLAMYLKRRQKQVPGLIGNTPMTKLQYLSNELSLVTGLTIEVYGKCEYLNNGGSPKDRVAKELLDGFERDGLIQKGYTVYEGTIGSTGISLAWQCRARGYKCYICIPDDVAQEKVDLLMKYGATVERVPPASIIDSQQYVNVARSRAEQDPCGVFADQFENFDNIRAHYTGTGPEIYADKPGITHLVLGAGTGGTLVGCAQYLKSKTHVKVVLADPQGSGLYNKVKHNVMYTDQESEGTRRRHQTDSLVEGIGLTRRTSILDVAFDSRLIDEAYRVTDEEALLMSRYLAQNEGLFLGSSSAVNVAAAVKLAFELKRDARIVTVLCDSGSRHMSKFWNENQVGIDIPQEMDSLTFLHK